MRQMILNHTILLIFTGVAVGAFENDVEALAT